MKKIFLLLLLQTALVNAQWQPDVRLTNNAAVSLTSLNNAWCVAANSNYVHAVWLDQRDGNNEIYYKRSTDGGLTWGTDTRLTNDAAASSAPSVFVSGQVIHVAWNDDRDGNYEIYYKRSTTAGASWGPDTRLTNNSSDSYNPSVAVSNTSGVVNIVWHDYRDGNAEIYYKRSTDGGLSWGTDTRLTNNTANSFEPSLTVSGTEIHVAWWDFRDANYEIYYKRSSDGGVSWGTDIRLTNNSAVSFQPSLAVSGSVVHVVWHDNRDGNYEIYYKRSSDGGISWGTDTRLTNDPGSSDPCSISVSGQVVHVVWRDDRDGNQEIYYKRSTDGGLTWESDTRLTNNSAISDHPSVAVNGQVVHVVWCDFRDGNYEIYYKLNPTGTTVGVTNINNEIPEEFNLEQNYPNPFNPNTVINFQLADNSLTKLVIYDILGREIATIVNEQLNAGTYKVNFDGSNVSSGIYYYKLIVGENMRNGGFVETKRMVLLK